MVNRKNIFAEVSSILVFALGVFTLVSLLSYHASDPSIFSNAAGVAQNACGRVGSYVSSILLNFFGLGAFIFPGSLLLVSATLHRRSDPVSVCVSVVGMAATVSAFTVFLALQWKTWSFGGNQLPTGGLVGSWIARALQHHLNYLGATWVALVVLSISIALTTPLSVAHWGGKLISAFVLILMRLGKLALTYLVYLAGLVLMRLAQKMEKIFRKSKEQALVRAQQRSMATVESSVLPVDSTVLPSSPSSTVLALTADQEPSFDFSDTSPSLEMEVEAEAPESKKLLEQIGGGGGIKILPREVDSSAKVAGAKAAKPVGKTKRGHWQLPTVEFLRNPPCVESAVDRERLISNSQILQQKFADFGIQGEVTAVRPGPVITLYEFKPGPGVKVSRIAALADDLSMALSARSVRILAPLPGKSVVGIEIPSENREMVYLREFLQHPDFYGQKHSIPVVMGKDIGGQTYLSDLDRMPHLLCAGQTGSGKSVFMNGLICSLFYRFTPDELRMILVDPKFIEFRAYQDIPHLLLPVVDDPKQASTALKWAVREMERRYRILAKLGARNLASFNQKVDEMGADVVRDLLFSEENLAETPTSVSGGDWIEAFEPDDTGAPRVSKLPYIVVIIDELADLMMIAKKEVEISIARIAQKARAAGIHLVIATQRPSTDVIIKANLPSRVSFQLASFVDSKTILDRAGAERLLGQGDMLFIPPGVSQNVRLHGAFLDDEEINKITSFLRSQGKPAYRDEILLSDEEEDDLGGDDSEDSDELMQEAVELVKRSGHASASFLQRQLKVGYNRAARMIETMETRGIVGPQDGARPREVLIR